MITLIALAIATGASPVPLRYRCGPEAVRLIQRQRRRYLMVGSAQYSVRRILAGHHAAYVGKGATLRIRADGAVLTVGRRPPAACTPVSGPFVDYEARGQEPGWYLALGEGRLRLDYANGTRHVDVALPPRQPVRRGYRYAAPGIAVAVTHATCRDSMSGRRYRDRVSVRVGGMLLHGCGEEAAAR